MIRNEYMGYEVGVALGAMNHNPLSELDWTLDALERGFLESQGLGRALQPQSKPLA